MPRRRWSEQQVHELLHEQERSGASLKAFAEAAEVPCTTLSWWRTRLRRESSPRLVPVHVQDDLGQVEIVAGEVAARVAWADVVPESRAKAAAAPTGVCATLCAT